MAYSTALAAHVRDLLGDEQGVREQKMFGGLAFLVDGNMAVAASGQGGLMVRVDPDAAQALVASSAAREMEMRGRPMRGWLRVAEADVGTASDLEAWVRRGVAYARSLPPKA
jgi:TfoX/Sxy family transcriptional regulator of competence genes